MEKSERIFREMYKVYSGKRLFLALSSSAVFCRQNDVSRFLLICFAWEIKGFCQSSFGNEIDITNMNIFPNILAKNLNLEKLRHGFVDERAMTAATFISLCHWKTVIPFCLQKKRPENAFLTLTVNYCYTEKQIMPFKTTVNWLFTDI